MAPSGQESSHVWLVDSMVWTELLLMLGAVGLATGAPGQGGQGIVLL